MASILYLSTDEGIVTLKSENGSSWNVEGHGLQDWSVTEAAVIASAPNRVFAGVRGDGIWLSEDFGKSWKKPSYGKHGPGKVRCITIDPHDPTTLYVGAEPIDVFVSRDSGRQWTKLDSIWEVPWVESVPYPGASVEPHVRDIAVDPKNPKTIYVALQVGYMLKSTDGGSSWKLLNKDLDADVHTIVIHPHETDTVVIATGGSECRKGRVKGRALYKSSDAGENWAPMAMEFEQEYSVPLAMHPKAPNLLFSALANGNPGKWRRPTGAEAVMIRSNNAGQTWEALRTGLAEVGKTFVQAIAVDETQPEHLYAATRSGKLYESHDSGDTWEKLNAEVSSVSDMKFVQV
jgi:photosystem II stability/assembly factor-like uncharacterized protein